MNKFVKVAVWILVAFAIFAIFRSPAQSAGIVHAGFVGIISLFEALGAFFDALLRGS